MDREAKVSTVTSSSDLPLRGQGRVKKSNFLIISNNKTKSVFVLGMDREKIKSVHGDLVVGAFVQRSKRSKCFSIIVTITVSVY